MGLQGGADTHLSTLELLQPAHIIIDVENMTDVLGLIKKIKEASSQISQLILWKDNKALKCADIIELSDDSITHRIQRYMPNQKGVIYTRDLLEDELKVIESFFVKETEILCDSKPSFNTNVNMMICNIQRLPKKCLIFQ